MAVNHGSPFARLSGMSFAKGHESGYLNIGYSGYSFMLPTPSGGVGRITGRDAAKRFTFSEQLTHANLVINYFLRHLHFCKSALAAYQLLQGLPVQQTRVLHQVKPYLWVETPLHALAVAGLSFINNYNRNLEAEVQDHDARYFNFDFYYSPTRLCSQDNGTITVSNSMFLYGMVVDSVAPDQAARLLSYNPAHGWQFLFFKTLGSYHFHVPEAAAAFLSDNEASVQAVVAFRSEDLTLEALAEVISCEAFTVNVGQADERVIGWRYLLQLYSPLTGSESLEFFVLKEAELPLVSHRWQRQVAQGWLLLTNSSLVLGDGWSETDNERGYGFYVDSVIFLPELPVALQLRYVVAANVLSLIAKRGYPFLHNWTRALEGKLGGGDLMNSRVRPLCYVKRSKVGPVLNVFDHFMAASGVTIRDFFKVPSTSAPGANLYSLVSVVLTQGWQFDKIEYIYDYKLDRYVEKRWPFVLAHDSYFLPMVQSYQWVMFLPNIVNRGNLLDEELSKYSSVLDAAVMLWQQKVTRNHLITALEANYFYYLESDSLLTALWYGLLGQGNPITAVAAPGYAEAHYFYLHYPVGGNAVSISEHLEYNEVNSFFPISGTFSGLTKKGMVLTYQSQHVDFDLDQDVGVAALDVHYYCQASQRLNALALLRVDSVTLAITAEMHAKPMSGATRLLNGSFSTDYEHEWHADEGHSTYFFELSTSFASADHYGYSYPIAGNGIKLHAGTSIRDYGFNTYLWSFINSPYEHKYVQSSYVAHDQFDQSTYFRQAAEDKFRNISFTVAFVQLVELQVIYGGIRYEYKMQLASGAELALVGDQGEVRIIVSLNPYISLGFRHFRAARLNAPVGLVDDGFNRMLASTLTYRQWGMDKYDFYYVAREYRKNIEATINYKPLFALAQAPLAMVDRVDWGMFYASMSVQDSGCYYPYEWDHITQFCWRYYYAVSASEAEFYVNGRMFFSGADAAQYFDWLGEEIFIPESFLIKGHERAWSGFVIYINKVNEVRYALFYIDDEDVERLNREKQFDIPLASFLSVRHVLLDSGVPDDVMWLLIRTGVIETQQVGIYREV